MIMTLLPLILMNCGLLRADLGLAPPVESAIRNPPSEILAPAWFPKAAPLPPPQGEVIRVATVDELLAAVERIGPGGTILLAEGHYRLPRVIVLQGKKDIALRSAGGEPDKVVLSGRGWDSNARGDDILHVGHCDGVTIADLTFTDCRSYGIKVEAENAPRNVHIYNCRFRDIGVRAIKGSAGQDPNVHAVKGSVRYCRFENTKVPPADWLFGGDYIAAIDMMALDDWTFSDNVFRNIKGRTGGGRAAIFLWVRSQRVTVERNLIVNCDRGIAFGNPGQSTANRPGERLVYVGDGIIRNNFIAGGPDCGIELWYADGIKVYNNSIWRPERNWSRGIRVGKGTVHTEIANNLVHGEIRLEGGEAQLRQNLAGRLAGYFTDPASGDLTLTSAATKAIDQGVSLPEVTGDIRGQPRSGRFDLGAWERMEEAKKFGVHEVILHGDGSVGNPFGTVATVTFTPPTRQVHAKTVYAFYDGNDVWRARVYVSEPGAWKWASACQTDKGLDGRKGTFTAQDSHLRGRLLTHPGNPRQWRTEDGRWFLNLNDTAYFLLCTHDAGGKPIPFEDLTAYVRDAVAKGITSFRSFAVCGPKGFGADGTERWTNDVFADASLTRFRLDRFQETDRRLRWLLDNYPDVYVQFILFPLGSRWKVDETFWKALSDSQKERLLRWMLARYAAYPQIFWLVVNDAHYGPEYPNNNAFAREVGAYFCAHDPWQHPLSTGHARKVPFYFGAEDWATYLHLEDAYDLGAAAYPRYHQFAKPVFLGEDRYEQDHFDLDPQDMQYFQRRLFWSWLLSGGSANYGGRWWVVQPYNQTGRRAAVARWQDATRFTAPLTGLDSVPHIERYFRERQIELSDFEPDHGLASDPDGARGIRAPKLMRRGADEYLVYHPNAGADGREARVDAACTPRLELDLSGATGTFAVEWYRPADGVASPGGTVEGGGRRELVSPWKGADVVLRLTKGK